VIFLTCKTEVEDEKRGLDMGAVDFIVKPIISDIVMARVKNHLEIKFKADRMQDLKNILEIEMATLKHPIPSTFQ
jgi:putative two-component system response regulator